MDPNDLATYQEEKAREAAQAFRKDVPRPPLPTGFCLNCGTELQPSDCFCDPEPDGDGCERDWEKRQEARRRNGK